MIEQEQHLFGVDKGALVAFSVGWSQNGDGTDAVVKVVAQWANRKPSEITIAVPEDQHMANYITMFMPIIINGYWFGKKRAEASIKAAMLKACDGGAEVATHGTRLIG